MKKQQKNIISPSKSIRGHQVSFMLNDEEYNAIKRHLSRYKITNKSNWYRTTIMAHVLKVMEEDYPTLFNENEMRR
ncbi:MAG: hypothetical protein LBN71_00910 [Tannerella sp.]|nr:hypothetical protein [Tannerella sp.]